MRRIASFAVLAATVGLTACASQIALPPPAVPIGVEQRHPILLTRSMQSAVVDVPAYSAGLNVLQRGEVQSFARAFRSDGAGEMSIHVPQGAPNQSAAFATANTLRQLLQSAGVPPAGIQVRAYQPAPGVASPPILLAYPRVRASITHRCGSSSDLDITFDNAAWDNFGCANQQNFAAMVANPNDVMTPRPMDRIDPARRYTVIDAFRSGNDTATLRNDANAGSLSTVGR